MPTTEHAHMHRSLLVRMDHCTEPDPPADPGGPTHVLHDPPRPPQVVSSTDAVVGRASFKAHPSAATAIVADGAGTTLRVVGCQLEGGAENGVGVQRGASADLQDCVLGLSAEGRACVVFNTGSSAVLRGCRIEGCTSAVAGTVAASLGSGMPALHASAGGSLVLKSCKVDVDGMMFAVGAADPGADGGHNFTISCMLDMLAVGWLCGGCGKCRALPGWAGVGPETQHICTVAGTSPGKPVLCFSHASAGREAGEVRCVPYRVRPPIRDLQSVIHTMDRCRGA
jgi:hypothetical protein